MPPVQHSHVSVPYKSVLVNSGSHCFHKNVKYIYNFICHVPALQISERSTCLGLHSWQIAELGFHGWQLVFISIRLPPCPAHSAFNPSSAPLMSCSAETGGGEEKGRRAGLLYNIYCVLLFYGSSTFPTSLISWRNSKGFISSNLQVRKLRLRERFAILTLTKSTPPSKEAPALSDVHVRLHKIKEQHIRKGRVDLKLIPFHLFHTFIHCLFFFYSVVNGWRKVVSARATTHSLLMADLTQT